MYVTMEGGHGGTNSNAPPPFLTKTFDMLEDAFSNPIVSWSHDGNSFIVWNPLDFARDLLPKYFKHNNFSSFVRQLNTYGFRKIDPDQWEFANEEFIRGHRHLLKNIHRRKPIHSHSSQNQVNSSIPLSDSKRQEFEEEIEKLKSDNTMLQIELQRYKHENQGYQFQLQSLGKRLQKIEHGQRKMLASLAQLLQNPNVSSRLIQQVEYNSKKRRLLISSYLNNEANTHENGIPTFLGVYSDDEPDTSLNIELVEKLSSSLNFWGVFLDGVANSSGIEFSGFEINQQRSSPIITEGDTSPDNSRDIYIEKSSGINVNVEPYTAASVDKAPDLRSGPNDMFWEQFLTETPGCSDSQEVQSERRDIYSRKNENQTANEGKVLWNVNNLDSLTEQMGLLSPSERLTG